MLEGLYTAAAGMAAQQQRMDALSNDVANVNTSGYKHVRMGFRDLIYQQDGTGGPRTGSGAATSRAGRSHSRIVPSSPPETMSCPSKVTATVHTGPSCPRSGSRRCMTSRLH